MWNGKTLCCVAMVMLVTTVGLGQEEDGVSIGVTADVFSMYVWRGQNVVDNCVLQPGAFASYKGLTGSVWSNVDMTGEVVDDWEFNEIDWALDYSNTVRGMDLLGYSLGVIYYDFPNMGFKATTELYAGLSVDVPLSPAVRWFYDIDEMEGGYIQLSVGHTEEKLLEWTRDAYCGVQVGVSVGYGTDGYNDGYFGVDASAMNDLVLSAGLPICLGLWTFKPVIAYSTLIDDDIRAVTAESDNFWGGVSVSYNF